VAVNALVMTKLSIIIPAYNEQSKIGRDIIAADHFLTSEGICGEIIVVDDGSTDTTAETAREAANDVQSACTVERLDKNSGKGRAVRTVILKRSGEFVLFADSGNCVPYLECKIGIELICSGKCRIAHGSRKLLEGHIVRPQSIYRKICSGLFHWFLIHDIKRLGNLTDTQCGFKVYHGDTARTLYAQSTMDGFAFDIEIILLALSQGLTICEFPVDWTCDPDSRLKPARQAVHVLSDLIHLKKSFKDFLKKQ
jgi:dolichyl-phosphate beta-glucosyltransferase